MNDEPSATLLRLRSTPRTFTVENPPVSAPATLPTDVREHFATAASVPPNAPALPAQNDVHQILRTNVAAAEAAGLNAVKPVVRRPSRRRRDYLIVALVINLLICGIALYFHDAPVVLVFALSAFVMFNLRLAWSMWVVLDDY